MAGHSLQLESEWIDPETVKVSWVDVKMRERTFSNDWGTVLAIICGFIVIIFLAFALESPLIPFIGVGLGIFAFNQYGKNVTEPNSITIGKTDTRHRDKVFPTAKITRFEMGTELALEGGVSTQAFMGRAGHEQDANQTIIRLWVDDARAYNITKNNWQTQVNHEIRDALAKALSAVRDLDTQQESAEQFGVVDGETGMPDY